MNECIRNVGAVARMSCGEGSQQSTKNWNRMRGGEAVMAVKLQRVNFHQGDTRLNLRSRTIAV